MTRRRTIRATVQADLSRLPKLDEGIRPTWVAQALHLASMIDSWTGEELSAAQMSAVVKAHQQLAALMARLAAVPADVDDFDKRMGTPTPGEGSGGAAVSSVVRDEAES